MSAYTQYKKDIEAILEPDKSFDILKRSFTLTYASEATFYYIDGFTTVSYTHLQLAPYENRTLRIGPNFDLRCAVKVNMLEE